jgi:polyisoprenoid-binding protein YceI
MRVLVSLALLTLAAASHADTVLPAANAVVPQGTYTLDKAHTSLVFRVNHLSFSTFTARFTRYDATLEFDPAKLGATRLSGTIDAASIASDNPPDGFHDMLRSAQFLDTAKFPQMTFVSKSVEVQGPNNLRILGELTLHGVTRPIVLDAKYNGGYAGHPMDPHARIGFSAHGTFKRSDFGISTGIPAAGTKMGVGDEIEVTIETELSGPAFVAAKS